MMHILLVDIRFTKLMLCVPAEGEQRMWDFYLFSAINPVDTTDVHSRNTHTQSLQRLIALQ